MIFSRKQDGSGRHAQDGREQEQSGSEAYETNSANGGGGPYDVAEAPQGVQRLDLGSLQIPAVADVEVRVQANPDGTIQQVVLVHAQSALQLGAFAAPRTEGIWDEVREEIRQSLLADSASVREVDGTYGVELLAQVQTPEGSTDLRFVGIDGPRWMVRGVYQGAAAVDSGYSGSLAQCLAQLVVVRGQEPKPVREPLPLRLPPEVAEQAAREGQEGSASALAQGSGAAEV